MLTGSLFAPSHILLVIAPTLIECRRTADDFGVDPRAFDRLREIRTAHGLRGWRRGTPFIALHRDAWHRSREGRDLDHVLSAMTLSGRLRIASEHDLAEVQYG